MVESYGAVESLVISHNSVPLHELVSTESQGAIICIEDEREHDQTSNIESQSCSNMFLLAIEFKLQPASVSF